MAKSKNHTNHNQSYKNHRNGIKAVPDRRQISSHGMNQVYMKNRRRAQKFDPMIKKAVNFSKKIEKLRHSKDAILKSIKLRIEKQKQKRLNSKKDDGGKKKKRTKKPKK